MVLLVILGWLALGLLVLVLLLLVTPIHLRLIGEASERLSFRAEVRVISSRAPRLFRVTSGAGGRSAPRNPARRKRKPSRKAKQRKRSGDGFPDWARRMLRAAPDALRSSVRAFHVDRLRVAGEFGFEDPADTGQLWGFMAPFVFGGLAGPADLALTPRFDRSGVRGEAEAALHFTPIRVLWPGVTLFLRAAPWRR